MKTQVCSFGAVPINEVKQGQKYRFNDSLCTPHAALRGTETTATRVEEQPDGGLLIQLLFGKENPRKRTYTQEERKDNIEFLDVIA